MVEARLDKALAEVAACDTVEALTAVKQRWLGRNGVYPQALRAHAEREKEIRAREEEIDRAFDEIDRIIAARQAEMAGR